ncbi:DUF1014-domain-containing protein [Hesseltinella vesiculosa]|uniref:DUF1014-domain-containing protein n=1 Tax=Hesseltinella vesiculosa TaxID=101127 RepID=A0A1X2GRM1_9FUNG|nr:DUF1014-domain-containing protein [Hesseltinella vesiculosa]
MAKKGSNSKAEAAKDKKAAAKNEKDRAKAAQAEAAEADKWSQGAKKNNKKEEEADKKAAAAAKKAEAARLLAEEEKALGNAKPKISGADKKAAKKSAKVEQASTARRTIPEFSASNIDDALDLLSLNDSSSVKDKDVERHPERRFKAAYAAYLDREMPQLKQDNPGLRKTQLEQIAYKNFQKSPENPFNQTNVLNYNASTDDIKHHKDARRKDIEDRLAV